MKRPKTKWLAVSTAGLLVIGSWEQAIPRSHAPEEIARPAVRVVQGKVLGTLVEGGLAFKNLPYAAPPVGPNRWRAPQAASSWRGTRDASVFGPSCPQEPMGWNDVDAKRASEDCLSLNISTPRVGQGTGQPHRRSVSRDLGGAHDRAHPSQR